MTSADDRPRAPLDQRRDALPAAAAPAPRRPRRGPEGALAEHREQGGEEGEGGGDHHRDADRQDRPEPVGRLQVGDEEDEHRGDHGAARGGDRPGRVSRSASGSASAAGRPPLQLFAVAVDEQQRVVGPGAEDEHEQ